MDVEHCRKEFDAATAVEPVRAAGLVPDDVLEAFWRTAYALGFLSARHEPEVDWRADPAVGQALATLGPGGLCTALGAAELARLLAPLTDLAREALFAGARRPARPTTGRRVALAGPDSGLTRALAADLTDRGHAVRTVPGVDGVDPDEVAVEVGDGELRVRGSVLRFGVPYGPGVRCAPLDDLVLQSLVKQPMRVVGTVPGSYRLAHVWDVAGAVEALVESRGQGVFDLADGPPVTLCGLAELVGKAVRAVEVDLADAVVSDPGREPEPGSVGRGGSVLLGRPPIGLADGIRTVAQWLAYEVD
jgi:hypothetical protein